SAGDAAGSAVGRFDGQSGRLPGLHAALDVVRLEPPRLEHHRRELAAVAGAADHGDGLRRVERGPASRHECVQRDVDRAIDPAGVPFVLLTAVNELDVGEVVVDTFYVGEVVIHVQPGYQRPHGQPVSTASSNPR